MYLLVLGLFLLSMGLCATFSAMLFLKGHTDRRFFALNADVCCLSPLTQLLRLIKEKNGEAVILGTPWLTMLRPTNFGS